MALTGLCECIKQTMVRVSSPLCGYLMSHLMATCFRKHVLLKVWVLALIRLLRRRYLIELRNFIPTTDLVMCC